MLALALSLFTLQSTLYLPERGVLSSVPACREKAPIQALAEAYEAADLGAISSVLKRASYNPDCELIHRGESVSVVSLPDPGESVVQVRFHDKEGVFYTFAAVLRSS